MLESKVINTLELHVSVWSLHLVKHAPPITQNSGRHDLNCYCMSCSKLHLRMLLACLCLNFILVSENKKASFTVVKLLSFNSNKSWCFNTYTHSVWIMQLNTVKIHYLCPLYDWKCVSGCMCVFVQYSIWAYCGYVCDFMSMCCTRVPWIMASKHYYWHASLSGIGSIEILGDNWSDWCRGSSFKGSNNGSC